MILRFFLDLGIDVFSFLKLWCFILEVGMVRKDLFFYNGLKVLNENGYENILYIESVCDRWNSVFKMFIFCFLGIGVVLYGILLNSVCVGR